MIDVKEIGKSIVGRVEKSDSIPGERVCGKIVSSGDGIIHVSGLGDVKYNELLEVDGGYRALALNLEEDSVGAVLFSGEDKVRYGDFVYTTGKTAQMPVGEEFLGRIVDPLGNPLDGVSEIKAT